VSPVLGIMASSISGSVASSYESIATITPSGSTNTLTFSSIPSTFAHLQIRYMALAQATSTNTYQYMQFNTDTSSGSTNYATHDLNGNGTSATAGAATSRYTIWSGYAGGTSSTAYAVGIIDIFNYTSTTMNKTTRCLNGYDANGSGGVELASGVWFNSTIQAINSITIFVQEGATARNWTSSSKFALYGIKA